MLEKETSKRYSEPAGRSWVLIPVDCTAGAGSKEAAEESERPGRAVMSVVWRFGAKVGRRRRDGPGSSALSGGAEGESGVV